MGCAFSSGEDNLSNPDILDQAITAHGGLEAWQSYKSMTFHVGEERHVVDLQTRRTLQQGKDFTIGFDGDSVWITPDM